MINTKKIILGLLASSLSFTAFPMEQEATAPTEKQSLRIQTIDFLMNKLGHLRKCLQGKETCSKTDFAVIITTAAFLRTLFYSFGYKVGHSEGWEPHYPILRALRRVDPVGYGERAGRRLGYEAGKAVRKVGKPLGIYSH